MISRATPIGMRYSRRATKALSQLRHSEVVNQSLDEIGRLQPYHFAREIAFVAVYLHLLRQLKLVHPVTSWTIPRAVLDRAFPDCRTPTAYHVSVLAILVGELADTPRRAPRTQRRIHDLQDATPFGLLWGCIGGFTSNLIAGRSVAAGICGVPTVLWQHRLKERFGTDEALRMHLARLLMLRTLRVMLEVISLTKPEQGIRLKRRIYGSV